MQYNGILTGQIAWLHWWKAPQHQQQKFAGKVSLFIILLQN